MREQRGRAATASRLFVLLIGGALVLGGIAGFFYESDFGTGAGLASDNILGIFPTSGWDNVLHLIAGLACLAAASRGPRPMALAIGSLFLVVGLWGVLVTENGFGVIVETIPVNTEDNLLHLAVGLVGLGAALLDGGGGGRTPAAA
jgi:hypothetical protein